MPQLYIGPVDLELLGFEIDEPTDVDRESNGYVTEMVAEFMSELFRKSGAHRIRIEFNDANIRSVRVTERCGFFRDGYIR